MPIALNQLPDDIDALKSLVAEQVARNEQLTTENQRYKTQVLTLQEQLNLALAKRYAASSEKISPDQVCMFNEAEAAELISTVCSAGVLDFGAFCRVVAALESRSVSQEAYAWLTGRSAFQFQGGLEPQPTSEVL